MLTIIGISIAVGLALGLAAGIAAGRKIERIWPRKSENQSKKRKR